MYFDHLAVGSLGWGSEGEDGLDREVSVLVDEGGCCDGAFVLEVYRLVVYPLILLVIQLAGFAAD